MAGNSIGQMFRVTTFGESHGAVMGAVIDGCPPGLELSEADIQPALDRRRPGYSAHTTARCEADQIKILSGVYDGKTTGTPIGLQVHNTDARSKDYKPLETVYRPGHGDYSYQKKYGLRDPRGGGRASARETVMRVAAGAVAEKYLAKMHGVRITAYLAQVGELVLPVTDLAYVNDNQFFCADVDSVDKLEAYMENLQRARDSAGAIIGVVVQQVPVGLGEPVFAKLDAEIAYALMGINAVKGVEIGAGFEAARAHGSQLRDAILPGGVFASNHAGGILAGISTGQDILVRVAFKPTSSIPQAIATCDLEDKATEISVSGRHDPCVGLRAVPIVEAMLALVLMDHVLRQRAQCGQL